MTGDEPNPMELLSPVLTYHTSVPSSKCSEINTSLSQSLKAHANGATRHNKSQHCCVSLANNVVTCCVRLHGTATLLALVAYSLKPVKRLGPCKQTQHCWPTTPNNVRNCWHLLCPFAWAFKITRPFTVSAAPSCRKSKRVCMEIPRQISLITL